MKQKFLAMKRRILLATVAILLFAPALRAQGVVSWHLLTDDGKAVPVRNVVCLMMVDESKTINVLMADDNVLTGIKSVTFAEREEDDEPLAVSSTVEATATLNFSMLPKGAKVQIYTADGKLVKQAEAPRVDIGELPAGTYLIKINNTTVKMLKR